MLLFVFISSVLAISSARPNFEVDLNPKNVITVPPNCPTGQEWINGACRDIWRSGAVTLSPLWNNQESSVGNVITVPYNCPPGQEFINGRCRDIWRSGDVENSNLYNQLLEKLWNDHIRQIQQAYVNNPRNIINVPNQCPVGFKPDALGNCRPIL